MQFMIHVNSDGPSLVAGDELTFYMYLHKSDSGQSFVFPADSLIKIGYPGATNPAVVITQDAVPQPNLGDGVILARFSGQQTAEFKLGQSFMTIIISNDLHIQTFEVRAPFVVKARTLAM